MFLLCGGQPARRARGLGRSTTQP